MEQQRVKLSFEQIWTYVFNVLYIVGITLAIVYAILFVSLDYQLRHLISMIFASIGAWTSFPQTIWYKKKDDNYIDW